MQSQNTWKWRQQMKITSIKKIKSQLNSGNDCYLSLQNFVSSHLLCKDPKTRAYKLQFICFVGVLNLTSHIKGRTLTTGV
jgi:hypothetical protein